MMNFETELEMLINKYSMEKSSNTPDYILAQYVQTCLQAFNAAVVQREEHYGRTLETAKSQECLEFHES